MGNVSAGVPLAAMAAQVVGTPISAPVGPGGGFSLDGVPAGAVQLRFVGSGVDASVALSPVQSGDVVSVLVGVAGATAVVQSESRNAGGKVELEGRIESLTSADSSLMVAGRTVTTSAQTVFRDGNNATKTFADLAIGQRVHVRGLMAAEVIAADAITIQNTDVTIPVNVNGVVESLSGDAGAFEFFIGSRKVKGDDKTIFYGDSGLLGFGALKDGVRAEVKGEQREAHVYAVRIHVNGKDTEEPPQEDSASVEGVLSGLAGSAPSMTMKIGSTDVRTDSSTEVQRRGSVVPMTALAVGQTVHAVGVRQTDGWIVARKLQIKDDDVGGKFVIDGSIGGLSGSCATSLKFGINGYTIVTSATTKYEPEGTECKDLKNGMKAGVEGNRQTDGSVLATIVTKK
jgi:hypothetical protein